VCATTQRHPLHQPCYRSTPTSNLNTKYAPTNIDQFAVVGALHAALCNVVSTLIIMRHDSENSADETTIEKFTSLEKVQKYMDR
ncbi:hypothetical protein, partial [Serratia fonticola]|uniref:hypothetical protein n=1 Tax=Serratia fonticola TaxID=47917 RepID=UPI001C964FA0